MALRSKSCHAAPLQRFTLQQGTELLTHCAGLALVGLALNRFAQVRQTLDRWLPKRSGLSVGELVIAYVGLLCLGKSDFDAIKTIARMAFLPTLGLSGVPAASTLPHATGRPGGRLDATR